MDINSEFRRCLLDLDAAGARKLWAHVSPHLPAPTSDADALVALHMARTEAVSIPASARQYSHDWLIERGLPSQLPNPEHRIVEGVGISVNFRSPILKPAESLIRRVMEDAVNDAYAEGRTDPTFVSARMAEARQRETKALFG